MLETLWQDLRHGARMLVKNPGFSFVAIASIAIGVGANAAMFSAADTLVLRPLTVPRASAIVSVDAVVPRTGFVSPTAAALSYPDYVDVRDRARSFASLAAYRLILTGFADAPDQPARVRAGVAASGNLFDMLGVQAALGRTFTEDEDRAGARDAVVVLDHLTWQQQFASDPGIVGRRVRIGGIDTAVIGVMPAGFTGPDQFVYPGYYVPLAMLPGLLTSANELTRRDLHNLEVKGRLASGASIAQADEEVRLIAADLEKNHPDTNRNQSLTARSELDARLAARPGLTGAATMLMVLAAAVLLVACANVAGLHTSRAPVRAREMALRLALGAGRLRLVRQLVAESLLLAAAGGAAGLAVAYGGITILRGIPIPSDVPLKFSFELDQRVVVVGMAIAALTALLSGLLPAWQSSRTGLVTVMKPVDQESARSRLWSRHAMVCGQVALSLMLLTVAVVLYRAFQIDLARGPGFRTERVLLMAFDPELARYDVSRADAFYRQLTERARALPGVTSVALASSVHMDPISVENTSVAPEGFALPPGIENIRVLAARVDEGFFDTMGIRLVQGRGVRPSDTRGTPRVAVVNQTFVAHYWPGQNPIGRRFRVQDGQADWIEIVGVAADVKYRSLTEGSTEFIYYPRLQEPATNRGSSSASTLLVATTGGAAALAAPLRDVVRALGANVPVFSVRTVEDFYEANAISTGKVLIQVVGWMGTVGLVLAMVGLYGLVAYSVSRRTREIGIRIAIGARPRAVLWMVLRQGLILAACGMAIGLLGSAATGGLLRARFPTAGSVATSTYFMVVPTVLLVTLVSAYIPARRAARIDPIRTLRTE